MSTPTIDTTTDLESQIFESLNLEDNVPCSWSECELEAVSLLKCPQCGAAETMCDPHTVEVLVGQKMWPTAIITFDNTCLHQNKYKDCKVMPLT